MGIQTQFDNFHQKIKLGREDTAYRKARERDDSITNAVKTAFKEAGYPITQTFIQGSLATSTAVVPLDGDYDIDRAIVIDNEQAPDNPVTPKIKVHDLLVDRGFKNARIKTPCVTADYSSEAVHIDFPIYKQSGEQHHLAVGKRNSGEEHRSWSASDPRGLIDWITSTDGYLEPVTDTRRQFQRVVRYLKRWRDYRFSEAVAAKVYSIGLTVMVKEQFRPSFSTEGSRQDLLALRDTVDAILSGGYFYYQGNEKYGVTVHLPVQPWRDIFDGGSSDTATQFRNKLEILRDKLSEAAKLDDVVKQAKLLQTQFGDDFEVPESSGSGSGNGRARYASPGIVGTSQGA